MPGLAGLVLVNYLASSFPARYDRYRRDGMRAKLGLTTDEELDALDEEEKSEEDNS